VKLAVIGDLHVAVPLSENDLRLEPDPGRKLHGYSVELFEAAIAAVNAEPDIDAVLLLGDMTRDSEAFNHEVARPLVQRLRPPVYIMLGNHDLQRRRAEGSAYPDVEHFDRGATCQFYRGCGLPGGASRYCVDLPGVRLIVLDSNRELLELQDAGLDIRMQDDGWLGEAQIAWLDEMLRDARAQGRLPLVAVHHTVMDHSPAERQGHPLQFLFRYWQLHDAAATRAVLAKHRVPLVLSGHIHAQSANVQDGVYNLVTSATVSYPHIWRLVTVDDDAISIESRRLTSIASLPDLQLRSREWMSEGMGLSIKEKAATMPMLAPLANELSDFVGRSGWWPRFCDGTLSGFKVDPRLTNGVGGLAALVFGQVAGILDEYGKWKAQRPDANTLRIELGPYK
jgi:3',5'-cyclic AMP phosphodiesterase CpdA